MMINRSLSQKNLALSKNHLALTGVEVPTHPEISRIANVDDNNKIRSHGDEKSRYHRGNSLWHS